MQRGERQAFKSRESILFAFRALLPKGYQAISVGDIAAEANIGRSTFYRHFRSKADVFIAMHDDHFERVIPDSLTRRDWEGLAVPLPLQEFIARHDTASRPNFSFTMVLGDDADYVFRVLSENYAKRIEHSLCRLYSNSELTVPASLLAHAIAGLYIWIIQSWKHSNPHVCAEDIGTYLQRMIRTVILESLIHEDLQ